MGFLGSFGKALGIQNLNKGEGWNIARVIFPPIIATEVAVGAIGKGIQAISNIGANRTKTNVLQGGNYSYYGQGGGNPYGPPPAYSVYFSEPTGGQQPWDFSTSSIPFSIPLAGSQETSSKGSQGQSWEDFLTTSLQR